MEETLILHGSPYLVSQNPDGTYAALRSLGVFENWEKKTPEDFRVEWYPVQIPGEDLIPEGEINYQIEPNVRNMRLNIARISRGIGESNLFNFVEFPIRVLNAGLERATKEGGKFKVSSRLFALREGSRVLDALDERIFISQGIVDC